MNEINFNYFCKIIKTLLDIRQELEKEDWHQLYIDFKTITSRWKPSYIEKLTTDQIIKEFANDFFIDCTIKEHGYKLKKIIEVVDWITHNSGKKEAPIGGLGGWFNSSLIHDKKNPTSMVWEDYVKAHKDESIPYLEALKKEIVENNLQITGQQHQYNAFTPLFSDGTVGEFSYRAWGDLMAAIYSTKENPLSYMAYYM